MELKEKNKLVIIGAGGHGKVVADIARLNNYSNIVFADDNDSIAKCGEYSVVCRIDDVSKLYNEGFDIIVAVGNAVVRQNIQERLERSGRIVSLAHPNSTIASDVVIGKGTVIMAGVVINPGTRIGEGCIINTGATVDHDNIIKNYSHISVGVHLAGAVTVGKRTWIGAGAVVINNINICDDCIIGAGAVVVKTIDKGGKYMGVPAKYCGGGTFN